MPFDRFCFLMIAVCAGLQGENPARLDFQSTTTDPSAMETRKLTGRAVEKIQKFFGAPFPDPIHVRLVQDRAGFDAAVAKFGLGATECWMVGMGTGDLMVLLSPSVWAKQGCEHDPADRRGVEQLVVHELVHVYHGQQNTSRDFSGIDDLDWFVEGVAVFASGQLDVQRLENMRKEIAAGKAPGRLSKVWTGPGRYGFAGSLVAYVDGKWGRSMLVRLMKTRSTAEALAAMGTDEKTLLDAWQGQMSQ